MDFVQDTKEATLGFQGVIGTGELIDLGIPNLALWGEKILLGFLSVSLIVCVSLSLCLSRLQQQTMAISPITVRFKGLG